VVSDLADGNAALRPIRTIRQWRLPNLCSSAYQDCNTVMKVHRIKDKKHAKHLYFPKFSYNSTHFLTAERSVPVRHFIRCSNQLESRRVDAESSRVTSRMKAVAIRAFHNEISALCFSDDRTQRSLRYRFMATHELLSRNTHIRKPTHTHTRTHASCT